MAAPWEKYGGQPEVVDQGGPWSRYGASAPSARPDRQAPQVDAYQPGLAWDQQPFSYRSLWEQKAEDELAGQFEKQAPFDIAGAIYGRPSVNAAREPLTADAVKRRAEEMAREADYAPSFGGWTEKKAPDAKTIMNYKPEQMDQPSYLSQVGDKIYDLQPPKMGVVEAGAKGAADMALAVPGVKSLTSAAMKPLGTDRSPAQLGQDWEGEATRALEDRPMSFRLGQGAALAAGGTAQLTEKAIANAPKLVAPSLAAKFAGEQALDKGARYGGRLAALGGIGAADYAAFNAVAEAPNQSRMTGEPVDRMGTVLEGLKDPIGYAPLPAMSLLSRAGRGAINTVKDTAIESAKAGKLKFVAGAVTPKNVAQRVTIPQMTKGPGASERAQAINLLLKKGLTAEHIEEMVNLYHYNGYSSVDEALLQLANNPKVDQLTVALGTVGGDAQETMRGWFQQQIASSPQRLQADLRKATGLDGSDFYDAQKKLKQRRVTEPGKSYDAAYAKEVSPETWEGQILPSILDYDGAVESLTEAAARAAASGKPGTREAAGELYRLADEVAAIKKAAVDAGYPGGLVPAGGLAELSGKTGSNLAAPGKVSTQALDQLDRVLGDKAKGLTSGARPELAGTVLDTQGRIRGTGGSTGLDPETGLNVGRDLSAELKSAEKALDFGRKAFRSGTDVETLLEEFSKEMKRYGVDGEPNDTIKGALLLGWLRGAEDEVAKATNPGAVIRQLYGSARQREKLVAMMPKLEEAAGSGVKGDQTKRIRTLIGGERSDGRTMPSRFDREKNLLDWQNRTVGNSQTGQRVEAVAEQGGAQRRIEQAIDFVDTPRRMVVKGAKDIVRRSTMPAIYKPGVNKELGNILTTSGKDDLLKVADEMRVARAAKAKPKLKIGAPSGGKGPVRGAGMLAGARGDLASGAAGGAIGSTQGDTPEERRANAAMGFASGIAAKRGAQGLLRAASRPLAREVTRATRMASEAIESIPKPSRPGQPMTGAEADDLLTARLNEVLARKGVDPEDFYAGTAKIDQKKFAPMQEAERLVLEDMKALGYGPPADAEWLRAIRTFSPEQYNKWQATGARDMVSKFRQVQGKEMSPEIPPFEGPRVIDSPGRSMLKPRPSNDVRSSGISGKPPKLPKKRLGRSLDDLINEPGPAQPPRPADMPVRKQEPSPQATKPSRKPARTTRDEFGDKPLYTIRRQPKDTPGNLKKGDWLPIEGLKKKQNPILEGQGDGKREWVVLSDSASGAKKAFDRGEGMTKTNGNVQDLLTRGKPKTIFVPIQFGNGKKMRDMVQTAFDDGADVVKLVFPDKREVYVARDASVLRSPRAKFGVRGRDNKDIMAGIPLIGAGAGATSTLEDRPLPDRDSKGRFMAIGSR